MSTRESFIQSISCKEMCIDWIRVYTAFIYLSSLIIYPLISSYSIVSSRVVYRLSHNEESKARLRTNS